jgi:hypothetical protein
MRLQYIEVPLFVSWRFSKNFSVEGGASFGVLVHSKEENEYGEINTTPAFEKMEYSANVGIRYTYKEHWSFNIRLSQSFLPIRKNDEIGYTYEYMGAGQYNTVIQNTFCYTF